MTEGRYQCLMNDFSLKLTQGEISVGWHFCPEFDGLLIGPGMEELRSCVCNPKPIREARKNMENENIKNEIIEESDL